MNRFQEQVIEFHRKFGQPIRTSPEIISSRVALRAVLILEEAAETSSAMQSGDLAATADGIADLIYVAVGTAIEFGIDLEPVFDLVHRANMAKEGGGKRSDGKILKPSGWTPPDVQGEIDRQIKEAR